MMSLIKVCLASAVFALSAYSVSAESAGNGKTPETTKTCFFNGTEYSPGIGIGGRACEDGAWDATGKNQFCVYQGSIYSEGAQVGLQSGHYQRCDGGGTWSQPAKLKS
ncbi:hypothetical protein [Roseibium sp.]|uniref:hypothetical protein n=1 Tax=Roseibium sp. TaxID=1936156 RepID=UPI003B52A350